MVARSNRTAKLDVRLTPESKSTIYAAAAAANRSVSEFVVDSALAQAEETLAIRRTFLLNDEQWEAFQAALNAPPRDLPEMRKLLNEPGFFDK
jgi:uncharacterized protein (DUF1778 family)